MAGPAVTRRAPAPARFAAQRGAATLALVVLLVLAMVLGAGFVNRNLVVEQRASVNIYRSTQAFEAAEAGLEWALARLNDPQRIGADCLPTSDAASPSFRERYVRFGLPTGQIAAATWVDAGVARPLQPGCVRDAAGWRCSCPAHGQAVLAAAGGETLAPAFSVRFEAGEHPGLVRAIAVGCAHFGGACDAGSTVAAEATAQVQVLLGLVPGLRAVPVAPLTAGGSIEVDGAIEVCNADGRIGGRVIHAGGAVNAPAARLTGPAGAAPSGAILQNDPVLGAQASPRFFSSRFGLGEADWAAQPVVRRVTCTGDCAAALHAASAHDDGPVLLHVAGDALIDGPATLGTAERPVLLVTSGTLHLRGGVKVTGVLQAGAVIWSPGSGSGGEVRGALLAAGSTTGSGAPALIYDAAVLRRLQAAAGTFARAGGSWRDF